MAAPNAEELTLDQGLETSSPLQEILRVLVHTADILLHDLSYDRLGWETLSSAAERGRQLLGERGIPPFDGPTGRTSEERMLSNLRADKQVIETPEVPSGWSMLREGYFVYEGRKCKSPHYTAWCRVDDLGNTTLYSEHGGVPVSVIKACVLSAPLAPELAK